MPFPNANTTRAATRPCSPARREDRPHLVLGGGPAGLTAGYLLAVRGRSVIVLEGDTQIGGLAKTAPAAATASTSGATASSPRARR